MFRTFEIVHKYITLKVHEEILSNLYYIWDHNGIKGARKDPHWLSLEVWYLADIILLTELCCIPC